MAWCVLEVEEMLAAVEESLSAQAIVLHGKVMSDPGLSELVNYGRLLVLVGGVF